MLAKVQVLKKCALLLRLIVVHVHKFNVAVFGGPRWSFSISVYPGGSHGCCCEGIPLRAQLTKKGAWLIGDKAPPAARDCSEVARA